MERREVMPINNSFRRSLAISFVLLGIPSAAHGRINRREEESSPAMIFPGGSDYEDGEIQR